MRHVLAILIVSLILTTNLRRFPFLLQSAIMGHGTSVLAPNERSPLINLSTSQRRSIAQFILLGATLSPMSHYLALVSNPFLAPGYLPIFSQLSNIRRRPSNQRWLAATAPCPPEIITLSRPTCLSVGDALRGPRPLSAVPYCSCAVVYVCPSSFRPSSPFHLPQISILRL